jgi:hypothetical protein
MWNRATSDLGRFGLGLKTASFSQCRVFSVVTKTAKGSAWRTWDLNFVIRKNEWLLGRDIGDDAGQDAKPLEEQASGTCVIWQHLDRLLGGSVSAENVTVHRAFLESADRVSRHLGMVFGDFLAGRDSIEIHVGRTRVEKWDPFLIAHNTQIVDEERLEVEGHPVTVRPHVLPHHTRLSRREFENAAGPNGWNAQQGFYIYRNRRMLVSGGWMNLGLTREEHMKLARIRIDIESSSDFLWQLDIRKSKAVPPAPLRDSLKRIARLTRSRASEVYRHRGQKILNQTASKIGKLDLWLLEKKHDKVRYRIDRNHPIVKSLLEEPEVGRPVSALLKMIEETIPAPAIYIGHAEKPTEQATPFEMVKEREIRQLLHDLFKILRDSGSTVAQARATLSLMTPFDTHPKLLGELDELKLDLPGSAEE